MYAAATSRCSATQKLGFLRYRQDLVSRGAKGIISGCTEIPLLVKKEDVDIQLFDTAIIDAEAALKVALNQPALSPDLLELAGELTVR